MVRLVFGESKFHVLTSPDWLIHGASVALPVALYKYVYDYDFAVNISHIHLLFLNSFIDDSSSTWCCWQTTWAWWRYVGSDVGNSEWLFWAAAFVSCLSSLERTSCSLWSAGKTCVLGTLLTTDFAQVLLHCVPKKRVTTFLMISWSRTVHLERFLAHLLLRVHAIDRCLYFPTSPISCSYFTLGNCQDLNISKN